MPVYAYHCDWCGRDFDAYAKMADRKRHLCDCGLMADIDVGATAREVQVMAFTPYTEYNGKGAPTFDTRAQRDSWLRKNRMTYDTDSYNRTSHRKPLIDDKLEAEILDRAANSPPVDLPTVSDTELNKGRVLSV